LHQNIERTARNLIVAFIARPVTGVRNPNTLCLCDVENLEALPLPADRGYKGREDGGAQIWMTLEKHHRPHAPWSPCLWRWLSRREMGSTCPIIGQNHLLAACFVERPPSE
jgi:hypothetical protein